MFPHVHFRLAAAMLAVAWAAAVQAGDIYKWTDDQGRTHLSDTVPPQYRNSATRQDSRQYELTGEQRREAEARAARDQARQRSAAQEAERVATDPVAAQAPGSTASAPPGKVPVNEDPCTKAWREYREKEACFGPFRTATGGIKEEAYAVCGPDMASPEARCGPPK